MKKVLLGLLIASATLFAVSGEEVYKQKCAACHQMQGMMDMSQMKAMRQKMQNATPEERQAMKAKMKKKMHESNMKAPAMQMVSMRLKKMTGSKEQFVVFVKDYIQSPSQEKGYCMPMAYKRFGVMPPIGKGLSEAERDAVANWLYDDFKGSWDDSMGGKMCQTKNKGMKCGGGKCGGKKSQMKCGAGKCGGNK